MSEKWGTGGVCVGRGMRPVGAELAVCVGASGGEAVAVGAEGLDEAVGDEGVEAAHPLLLGRPRLGERIQGDGLGRSPEHGEQSAAGLPVGAVPATAPGGADRRMRVGPPGSTRRGRRPGTPRNAGYGRCTPARPAPWRRRSRRRLAPKNGAATPRPGRPRRGSSWVPRGPCPRACAPARGARWCRRRPWAPRRRSTPPRRRCRPRCRAGPGAPRPCSAPARRAAPPSPGRLRAGAGHGGGSRAGPTPGRLRRAGPRRGRPAWASVRARRARSGSTRATGVCCDITSEMSTPHAVVPGRRHGSGRAFAAYQSRTRPCRAESSGAQRGHVRRSARGCSTRRGGRGPRGRRGPGSPRRHRRS